MSQTKRMVGTLACKEQDKLQRAHQLHNWGLSIVPPLARSLGLLVAISLIRVHLGDFICPHLVSQHQVVPANLRAIPNMVKNPFPSVEVFETDGAVQKIAQIVVPYGFNIMDSNECIAS